MCRWNFLVCKKVIFYRIKRSQKAIIHLSKMYDVLLVLICTLLICGILVTHNIFYNLHYMKRWVYDQISEDYKMKYISLEVLRNLSLVNISMSFVKRIFSFYLIIGFSRKYQNETQSINVIMFWKNIWEMIINSTTKRKPFVLQWSSSVRNTRSKIFFH